MILNSYAIVDGFLAFLRLPLALLVIGLAYRVWSSPRSCSDTQRREDHYYLLLLSATLLLGLNLVAWPLFYALLQSYVPQWPGVMCIYGVTQIGSGSLGPSRFLPGLLQWLQAGKPLVVFASGAWFALYLANRRLPKSELLRPTLLLMILFALVSVVDAALEGAYLLIPKSEHFLDVGCCTTALTAEARFAPVDGLAESQRSWVNVAYYGLNVSLPVGLLACRFRVQGKWLMLPLLAVLATLPVNWVYLVDTAAPSILGLPYHHCPYDLLPQAPEAVLGVALFFLGAFAVGWAWLVDRVGCRKTPVGALRGTVQRLLFLGAFGYLSSLALFTMEMALA